MSLLNFEGFAIYGTTTGTGAADVTQERLNRRYSAELLKGTHGVYPVAGFDGVGIALTSDNLYNYIDIPFGANQQGNTVVIGIRFYMVNAGTWPLFDVGSYFREIQTRVEFVSGDQVRIKRGGTTLATSAASVLTPTSWHVLEAKLDLTQGAGSYDIHVDGVSILSDAGPTDILEGTETTCDYVRVWLSSSVYVDDIYLLNTSGSDNNDYLGIDFQIEAYYPDADGSNTDFTPSAGSDHYALVDEAAESTSDYVSSPTASDIDTFTFGNVDNVTIYGIKLDAYYGLSLAAGHKTTRIKCISGVTTDNGDTEGIVDQTDDVRTRLLEYDPNTSALWTSTNLNAAEFGVEVLS